MKKIILIFMFLCLWAFVCTAEESDPFLLAAAGTPEQMQAAYNRGVRFNVKDEADKTPLHDAAISNHNPESIRFLIQQGIDVNAEWQTGTGFTPLLTAVLNYNAEAVEELLKNAAAPNFTDGNLSSVLQHAVTLDKKPAERKRIVSALIKAGADVNYHDDISNSSALASAVTDIADVQRKISE
ncbi:MAG: ankyrin repeat domain-containing protein [Synergistaceae bacterium]|nr:ankyrin repeat domain-containing protein [Synergistaceae bacterium]